MSRLLTIGTFDTPHAGHAAFLRRCERFADEIIVGVNTDWFVTTYKGHPPYFSFVERSALIRAMGYIATPNDGPGRALIEAMSPDIIAIGTDWAKRDYHAQIDTPIEYFESHNIALLYLPYTQGISTTLLKDRMGQP